MKIRSSRRALSTAALAVTALTLTACGSGRTDSDSTGGADATGASIIVGTTDSLTTLDPAGSYDNGSFHVQTQVFSFLMSFEPGSATLAPDAAESCDFTSDTVYTCTLKDGLTFANGNALTAESVKFSFERQLAIADPNGPSSLLANLESVEAPDEKTVEFTLTSPNDQTFAQVLASPVGPIVDEATYPADALLGDDEIVAEKATSGPYTIKSFEKNSLVEFTPSAEYSGVQGDVLNEGVTLKYYTDSNNLKLDIETGAIDVATRSLTATDIESLETAEGVNVVSGPGGEIRYIVFNFNTMPGDTPEQKLAVRKAVAYSVDRDDLSETVYKGTYTPLYSYVPEGLPGAATPFKDLYGTAPDKDAATKVLTDAGVTTPVVLNLQYNPDHYGPSSDLEYNAIKRQLEETGLFTVNLQSTEWVTYAEERTADAYPAYQLGWFPDFSDADNYLTPFFDAGNFLGNHFEDAEISALLDSERTDGDEASRIATIEEIQQVMAEKHLSTVPLLQGSQVAVARDGVTGVEDTLNASFQFRYSVLSKD